MKKVLIICHDFPPLHSVGALRPFSWYKYFPNYEIHPVIITRKWKSNIEQLEDKFVYDTGQDEVIQSEESTLIRMAPSANKRNALIAKYGLKKKIVQRKFLTLRDQIFSLFGFKHDELAYLYYSARKYLEANKVDMIIVTGEPFILFKYGNLLSDEFNTPWIADYRDEWKKKNSIKHFSILQQPLHFLKAIKEKEWTSNCVQFTSTSPPWVKSISETINKPGTLIRNGIDLELLPQTSNRDKNVFQLLFAGTLYDFKYIETLTLGLIEFIEKVKPKFGSFKFTLVGIELNKTKGTERFIAFANQHKDWIEILPSIPHEEAIKLEANSTVLLSLIPGNISQGIYAVKLYEYLSVNRPIINIESNQGKGKHEFSTYVTDCFTVQEFSNQLAFFYNQWEKGIHLNNEVPKEILKEFDRDYQCGEFSKLINHLLKK